MIPPELTRPPTTDPTEIYRLRDGIYAADLLAAAVVHLDFFTWLAKTPATLAQICRAFDFAERPVDVMLSLFQALNLVRREGDVFQATELAREHLVKDSPWNVGPYFGSLKDRPVTLDFLRVLRTDKPANWASSKDGDAWAAAMEQEKFAENFTAAMDSRGVLLGQALAGRVNLDGRRRLLDIGGGSGIYACAFAAANPSLQAVVFEKPPVDAVTRRRIEARGLDARVSVQTGDFFKDELPRGFDAHLFSNVLHDWDVPLVKDLLRKSAAALAPGGLLIIHDMHLNADKSGPLPAACYSAILMHATEGRIYGVAEMEAWLRETGFGEVQWQPTAADRSVMTAVRMK
ncbi:MAG: methyltransferase domain-containing protein [Verrucomicrobia bacterium]|nr:methyltransferase domain-containing protein [Verrucomicrobiota bacterium]